MDPLTILMWIGIVVGGCIALYLILQLLVILLAIAIPVCAGIFVAVATFFENRKRKKARVSRRGRGF